MIEKIGNLFTSTQVAIGHGCNVKGAMGAGIAKQFREFYPYNYKVYQDQCYVKGFRPGNALIVSVPDPTHGFSQRLICNLASQERPGPDATYAWLRSSIQACVDQLLSIGVHSMALPQIGCGIGGLEWERVKRGLLIEEESLQPGNHFEFEVWTYKE